MTAWLEKNWNSIQTADSHFYFWNHVWMLLAECSESISHNHTVHIKKCPDSIVGKRQRPQAFLIYSYVISTAIGTWHSVLRSQHSWGWGKWRCYPVLIMALCCWRCALWRWAICERSDEEMMMWKWRDESSHSSWALFIYWPVRGSLGTFKRHTKLGETAGSIAITQRCKLLHKSAEIQSNFITLINTTKNVSCRRGKKSGYRLSWSRKCEHSLSYCFLSSPSSPICLW